MKPFLFYLLFCFSPLFSQNIVIGIAGGSASGKTTLAKKIEDCFQKDVILVSQDSYFKHLPNLTLEQRREFNWDCPNAIDFDLLEEHIKQLKEGKSIEEPVRNFCTFSREPFTRTVSSAPIIVVEGILLFANSAIKDLCDIKIFIEADDDIRLLRRITRDLQERGQTLEVVSKQYINSVKPMHDLFVEPTKVYADLIIPKGGESPVSFDVVQSIVTQALRKQTFAATNR